MKKTIVVLLLFTLVCSLCACGASPAIEAVVTADPEPVAVPEPIVEPSIGDQMYEKYKEIISLLEEESYDSAISIISNMKTEAMAEKCGDINDYLVSVDLTPENFYDYFDFVTISQLNAFGEPVGALSVGLHSLKYDEGLLLYNINDRQFNDDITIEFKHDAWGSPYTDEIKLNQMLNFSEGYGTNMESLSFNLTRISGTHLTYIKKEFVDSYSIEPITSSDIVCSEATVVLKNGETMSFYANPNNPY